MKKKVVLFFIFLIYNTFKVSFFYTKISRLDLSFILFEFCVLFLIYFFLFSTKSKIVIVLFYLIQFLYLSINLTYYFYFKIYLQIQTFYELFSEGLITLIKGSFPFYYENLIFLLDLPFLLILLNKNFLKELFKENKRIILVILALAIPYLSFYTFFNYKKIKEKERIFDFTADFRVLEKFGLPSYQILKFLKTDEDFKKIELGKNIIKEDFKGKKFNIIFIQVESMDSSIINSKFENKPVMSYLNNLKSKAIFYPYVISYHYGGGTSDCEFSIINSLEPLYNFPAIKLTDINYSNSFIKFLKQEGYKAKAFHGNDANFWNRNYAFSAMGFDEFYDINKMELTKKGWGAPDEDVFEFALFKLKMEKKPFYYHIITMSSHIPFTNVLYYYNNSKLKKVEETETRALKRYFISMSYVDLILSKYVEEFSKIPNTYIFIYGDHVGLQDEGSFRGSYLELNGLKIEFVPLFIITPDRKVYWEKNLSASFLDIAPTALAASGIAFKYFTDGQNLLKFPIRDDMISPFEKKYSRSFLYKEIEKVLNCKKF